MVPHRVSAPPWEPVLLSQGVCGESEAKGQSSLCLSCRGSAPGVCHETLGPLCLQLPTWVSGLLAGEESSGP